MYICPIFELIVVIIYIYIHIHTVLNKITTTKFYIYIKFKRRLIKEII